MIIYIDKYIITNFCMNLFLIYITKLIVRSKMSKIRMFLYSLVVTACSLLIFVPYISTQIHIITNIVVTLVVLIVMFKAYTLSSAFNIIITYFTATFFVGGSGYMLLNLYGINSTATILLPVTIIAYFIFGFVSDIYEKSFKRDKLCHKLTIYFEEKHVELVGYFDTGNSLKDPISKLPVIIVGIESVKNLLPEEILYKMRNNTDLATIFSTYSGKLKLKLIPFHTVNGDGLFLGFLPQRIIIDNTEANGVIAISTNGSFSYKNNAAILHPQLIV